jgi:hypothetical protein
VKRQCQRVRLRAWWRFAIAATDRRSRHSAWQNHAKTRFAVLQVSACAERLIAGAGQDNHSYLVIVVRGATALGDTGKSPLMASRLSGRLMVIQNACPRFSNRTLVLSVIARLPDGFSAAINGGKTIGREMIYSVKASESRTQPS